MIINSHLYPSYFVDSDWKSGGDPVSAERLIEILDGPYPVLGKSRRIDYGIVQAPPGDTIAPDDYIGGVDGIRKYMAPVVDVVSQAPDRLIGCFTYNPRYGVEEGVEEFERLVKENGFKLLKINSNNHAYRPDRATNWFFPALEKAEELGVPVVYHMGETPYAMPSQFYPAIDHCPNGKHIMGHFFKVPDTFCHDAEWMAKRNENVWVETGWCTPKRMVEFVELLGPEKLIFAIDTPPNNPGITFQMLESLTQAPPIGLNLSAEDLEKILGDNLAALLGL